ncbi:hypothetical protein ACFSBZ_07695 [Amnibacterium flavum]|uniref:Bacterial Ig-like domain-containing protein n=1 Tax=Amnibacterium flavum TaxID=2173173 RepID=A0A2V1HRG1_9MICO|nr:hypothetical protein [Amnibacterium flavum]PVZ93699.1 hypothetical protein DDQ50_07805 [Amnibacterium flavum]
MLAGAGAIVPFASAPAVAAGESTPVPETPADTAERAPAPAPAETTAPDPQESTEPDTSPRPVPSSEPAPPTESLPNPGSGTAPELTIDPVASPVSLPLTVTGTRSAGSEVQVQLDDGSGDPLCIVPAGDDTAWSCVVTSLPDGPAVPIRLVALLNGTQTERSATVAWLGAPTIQPTTQATTAGQVGGTAYPGATVTARIDGTDSTCVVVADSSGLWTCVWGGTLTTGSYSVSATQTADFYGTSTPSAPVTLLIDRDAPSSPTITSPTSGARIPTSKARIAGTGDDGNSVLVFAGIQPVCQAAVSRGVWSCEGAPIPEGRADLTAIQLDPAGNASAASPAVPVRFASDAPASTPTPSASAGTTAPAPSSGGATGTDSGAGGGSGTGSPSASGPGGAAGGPTGRATVPTWVSNLLVPTAYGSALAPMSGAVATSLIAGLGLSTATIGLAFVPGLVGFRTMSGRMRALPSFTGRNRSRIDSARARPWPTVSRWTVATLSLLVAAVLAVLSQPVLAQSNYLRLGAAVLAGLAVVNLVGTALVLIVARRLFRVPVRVVPRPRLLGVSALAAVVTRVFGLTPPLAFGQVLGGAFDTIATVRARSGVALARAATLGALSIGAWTGYSLVGASSAGDLFLSELAATVTFAAAGAAAISLLPLGGSPGSDLLAHSRAIWAATTIGAWTLLFTVLISASEIAGNPGVVVAALVALGVGAVGAASWLWVRYVEPALNH